MEIYGTDGRKPTLYIGKDPFYINYAGVDRKTGEITRPKHEKPAPDAAISFMERFGRGLGLDMVRKAQGSCVVAIAPHDKSCNA